MNRTAGRMLFLLLAASLVAASCGKREGASALYVLEELEAASAVRDSLDRVERLRIFVENNGDHPYRTVAYERLLETMFETLGDEAGGMRYIRARLARETDPSARGVLELARFLHVLERDRPQALALVDTLAAMERSPRLFMMIGYYLMDSADGAETALRAFLRAAELAGGPHEASQALAMAGTVLKGQGRMAEARRYLEDASATGNPEADRGLAEILWSEGRREEALVRYIACVARMPGARRHVRLDSLYALVHPAAEDLDALVMAGRIADEGPFPEVSLVDLEGKRYDIARMRGTKLVIYALSPT